MKLRSPFRDFRSCANDSSGGQGHRFLKIAHRGYSEKYPENTLPAFKKAIEAGADMIELDVHLSKDDRIVVIHDNRIDRTSSGRGRVADLTFKQLKQYNYNNGMDVSGVVDIPSLEEVMDLVGDRTLLNIEIKKSRSGREGIGKLLIDVLKNKDFIDRVIVSSFDDAALLEIKKVNADVKTGMLYEVRRSNFREKVRALGVYSVHPAIRAVDMNQLLWAKSFGLMVYPWVVTDRVTLEMYRVSGFIDGAMVNDLGLFSAS